MAKATLIVTGDKEIDRALKRFAEDDNAGVRKAVRDASKASIREIVIPDFKRRVPVATGTLRDSIRPKAMKRSRNALGFTAHIDRDKLIATYKKRTGKEPGHDSKRNEPFFYPSVVELGGRGKRAKKPLRLALYENEQKIKAAFMAKLRAALNAAGRL